jgi:hypothetical protein
VRCWRRPCERPSRSFAALRMTQKHICDDSALDAE